MAASKSTLKRLAAKDDAMDKKRGIKENSPADKKLDAKAGLPAGFKNGGMPGYKNGGKVGAKKKAR